MDARIGIHKARRQQLAEILEKHNESTYVFVDERCHTPNDIEAMRAKLAARVETLALMRNEESATSRVGREDVDFAELF